MKSELEKLEKEIGIGKLKTREQFSKAMEYRESGQSREEATFRNDVLKAYVARNCVSQAWVWAEYHIFQLLDQLSDYFLPGAQIDPDLAHELFRLANLFVALALRNSLPLLEDYGDREGNKSIANNGGTCAEQLKAYLEKYKNNHGFGQWNLEHLLRVRPLVYEAVKDSRSQTRPSLGNSGKSLPE